MRARARKGVTQSCKLFARSCKSVLAGQASGSGSGNISILIGRRAEGEQAVTEKDKWQALAALIARHAPQDGRYASAINCLFFGRSSVPTEPMHIAQWASFALVAQGGKALHIGDDVLHYGSGDLLLVTLDMPVRACVTVATPEKPNLGIGITLNESRLMRYLEQFPPAPRQSTARNARGVTVHKSRHC